MQRINTADGTVIFHFFHLTYSRWASTLPSSFLPVVTKDLPPSLPGSRLTKFYRGASSALLQLVNQWLNFYLLAYSRIFRYRRQNENPDLTRIELTTSALAGVQVTYQITRATRVLTKKRKRKYATVPIEMGGGVGRKTRKLG